MEGANNLWTPERPLSELSENVRQYFLDEAKRLLKDLMEKKHTVGMIPNPDEEGRIRKVLEVSNPSWYKKIVGIYRSRTNQGRYKHLSWEKDRVTGKRKFVGRLRHASWRNQCKIQRYHFVAALEKVVVGEDRAVAKSNYPGGRRFAYHGRVRELILFRLIDGYDCPEEGGFIPPNPEVCRSFGLEGLIEDGTAGN